MNITPENLKQTIISLGYTWYEDRPNIIGVRTRIVIPDIFNDFLFIEWKENGISNYRIYPITTEPGVYYQKHLLNNEGCAIIEPGQYQDAYAIGYHKGYDGKKINPTTQNPYPVHRALILVGHIKVKRDKDLDGVAGDSGEIYDGTNTGCDIHGAIKDIITQRIGPWSAGCQVHAIWSNKEEMVNICEKFVELTHNRFTYTLLKEEQLIPQNVC